MFFIIHIYIHHIAKSLLQWWLKKHVYFEMETLHQKALCIQISKEYFQNQDARAKVLEAETDRYFFILFLSYSN